MQIDEIQKYFYWRNIGTMGVSSTRDPGQQGIYSTMQIFLVQDMDKGHHGSEGEDEDLWYGEIRQKPSCFSGFV